MFRYSPIYLSCIDKLRYLIWQLENDLLIYIVSANKISMLTYFSPIMQQDWFEALLKGDIASTLSNSGFITSVIFLLFCV